MTRATVGGINSEDNLWYPLAVNSQGIAQIDTSGIPQPEEWEYGTWTPSFDSTDSEGAAIIDYKNQVGFWAKLGDMVWIKALLNTANVLITNPRGSLIITGAPFTWLINNESGWAAGGSISYFVNWKNDYLPMSSHAYGPKLYHTLRGFKGQSYDQIDFADLFEGEGDNRNNIHFSYFGRISSEETPEVLTIDDELFVETPENSADTP